MSRFKSRLPLPQQNPRVSARHRQPPLISTSRGFRGDKEACLNKMKTVLWLIAIVAGIIVGACGGGGLSSGGGGNLNLFLTDSFREDYDHVWLTVKKVELRDSTTGQYTTAYDNAGGKLIDAKRLRDASGPRFAFLANGNAAQATYDGVRVTLGNDVVLVATGGTSGQQLTLSNPVIAFVLNGPLNVPGASPLVLDFDLANFSRNGSTVTAAMKQGDDTGLNISGRHENEDYHGTISNLSPTSFRLTSSEGGGAFTVNYDNNTVITRGGNGAPATLANGQRIEVRGMFVQGALAATAIKVEDNAGGFGEAEAKGRHENVSLSANTLTLTNLTEIEGFIPQGTSVNVTWTSNTVFRRSGVVVSENELNSFQFSEARGTYNATTNTISATRITLEDEAGGQGEAEAKGTITNVNIASKTFTLANIYQVRGFTQQGTSVNIRWTTETVFRRGGNTLNENALNNFTRAEVKGMYTAGTNTITVSRVSFED